MAPAMLVRQTAAGSAAAKVSASPSTDAISM
eukprot:CAMPEP_0114161112 /NCGR_PEP_ID=MMETSP0043_2-20121206/28748_1 /TAXON_ID=464988 /ORGANISM="Hemiselmis andersenii, Strain CCMP644" /LENGTH=30 /DNA_ID= /DNA_START= /DNA_END= /DNA_ORIENTATION=